MRFKFNFKLRWLLDAVLLVGLFVYAFVGVPLTPFHGDEGMLTRATQDFYTAFVDGNPGELMTSPPYVFDGDDQLRLLNGSVQRYVAGFAQYINGVTREGLPPPPGWNWGLSYEDNAEIDNVPDVHVLMPGRYTSATFFTLSIIMVYGIGLVLGGRFPAIAAAVLYGLNPVLLLNVRRAMQEGSVLLFGLMTVLIAAIIGQRITQNERIHSWQWFLLVLAGGFALGSKHTAAVFLMAAWLWIFSCQVLIALHDKQWRDLLRRTGILAVCGVLVIALFIGVSPALWSNPLARLQNLVNERAALMDIQVTATPNAPTSLVGRAAGILTNPFIQVAAQYEATFWEESPAISAQIERYDASLLAGLPNGWVLGSVLTLFALVGVARVFMWTRMDVTQRGATLGMTIWLLLTCAVLMVNPLPWQRYYLPLIPIVCLYAMLGMQVIVNLIAPPR